VDGEMMLPAVSTLNLEVEDVCKFIKEAEPPTAVLVMLANISEGEPLVFQVPVKFTSEEALDPVRE
jgi:hypothetical protein